MFSHDSLRNYVGHLVVIRRDNDEGDKPLVDRVIEADNGQLKLQNEGWIQPGDVLFTVSAEMPDHMIIGLAEVKRLSHDQARRLPEQIRQFQVREAGPTYAQVQEIVHDDAPWLFVANWKQNAVTTAAVQGFKLQPSFLLNLHGVTKQ